MKLLLMIIAILGILAGATNAAETNTPIARTATIAEAKNIWTLESNTLRAVVTFDNGSADLASLVNKRTGKELLTGAGPRCLFRHTVDGQEMSAKDGQWALGGAKTADITAFGKHWGRSLTLDLARPAAKLTVSLVFEIYDGYAGLRYGSFLQNDDPAKERTISASDILVLNLPDGRHVIDYVPWQTKWASTTGGLEKAKRNCLLRYENGDGLAILPENNWCTSLVPGAGKGDPKQPFLFMDVLAGNATGLRISTNPTAVQLTLFPRERFEYFWVNLQPFTGDALDGRAAVAEHFRKSFKYHDPLPQVDFQEYQVEYFQNDAMARQHLLPALAEAGFDKWEVTWRWNGSEASDSPLPRPGFTANLPALAQHAVDLGLKVGYYFTMHGSPSGWGGGRDLANPAEIAYKRAQVENILIKRYQSTWQMIDLGEMWKNDQPTAYSHPSDNVYRKFVNLRNYMNDMSRKYPDYQMLTTCETENPNSSEADRAASNQSVSLMLIGENGQAGAYKRTDGARDYADIQANLRDSMNYIGLMPLEAAVQVHGEGSFPVRDPWPEMFTTQAVYASLLGGCSTYYSDVRRWTPEQRKFLRQFNDWRKSPRISALLREVAHPLAIGEDNKGPYAWIYTNAAKTEALLIAVGFGHVPADFSPSLRTLDGGKTYLIKEVTQFVDGNPNPVYRGAFTGTQLKTQGLPINLGDDEDCATAFLLSEKTDENSQGLGTPVPSETKRPVTTDKGLHDAVTGGAWAGKYGALAAWLAGHKIEPANGFTLTSAAGGYDWGNAEADARVLAQPAGSTGPKKAVCWTEANQFTIKVGAPDSRRYRLSVYVLDYDKNGRSLEITVKSRDRKLHDRQTATVAETAKGVYLSWEVTGPATITVSKAAGFNAVVSGIFVDEVKQP